MSGFGEFASAVSANNAAANSTGVKLLFNPERPITVVRFGIIFDTASTTTALVLQLKKHPTFGGTGSASVLATLTGNTTHAVGDVLYADTADMSSFILSAFDINANEEVALNVATATTAGLGGYFIHYIERPFVDDRIGASASIFKKTAV